MQLDMLAEAQCLYLGFNLSPKGSITCKRTNKIHSSVSEGSARRDEVFVSLDLHKRSNAKDVKWGGGTRGLNLENVQVNSAMNDVDFLPILLSAFRYDQFPIVLGNGDYILRSRHLSIEHVLVRLKIGTMSRKAKR